MPKYVVTGPDGRKYQVTAPEGASQDEVIAYAQQQAGASAPAQPQTPAPAQVGPLPIPGEMSKTAGAVQSAIHGATFGTADELGALSHTLLNNNPNESFMDQWGRTRDFLDRDREAFAEQHPILSTVAEIAPSLPGFAAKGAVTAATKAPGIIRRILTSAGSGAASGAAMGAGDADGGIAERAKSAAVGAGEGAALSGALQVGGEAAVGMAGPMREGARRILGYIEERLTGNRNRTAQALPAPPVAEEKILQAIERDKLTPTQIADRLREQQALGKPVGIADVAGDNTRGLARATVTLPGQGRQTGVEALDARSNAQRSRVMGNVEEGLQTPSVDVDQMSRDIIERRTAAARPAYAKAEARGEIVDADLIAMMDRNPAYANAHTRAREMLAGANKNVPELFNPVNGQLIRYPTVADVDLIKKGLDRRLYNNKRGRNDPDERNLDPYFASLLEGERTQLLTTVDQLVPEYAAARAGFAGETAMKEALEAGQEFGTMNAPEIARKLGQMTDGEKEMYLTGVVASIRKAGAKAADGGDHVNAARSVAGYLKGDKIELLEGMFKTPEEFARFKAQMASEINMHKTRQFVMGGSQTANKVAEAEDSILPVEDIVDAGVSAAGGNFRSGAIALGRGIAANTVGRLKAGITEGTRSKVADELFNFDNAARAQDFLKKLEELKLSREAAMRMGGNIAKAGGVVGGGLAGQ